MIEVHLRPATFADLGRMVDIEVAAAALFPTSVLPEAIGDLRETTLTTFMGVPWNAPFSTQHGFKVVGNVRHYAHLEQALQLEAARGLKERVAMVRNAAT